jgi:hypothetical protein
MWCCPVAFNGIITSAGAIVERRPIQEVFRFLLPNHLIPVTLS